MNILLVAHRGLAGPTAARLRPRAPDEMVRQALDLLPPGTRIRQLDVETAPARDLPAALIRARRSADEVWLLYPDPIGLGALALDLAALRSGPRAVLVLNGRGRRFVLTPRRALRLWLRRALAWTWALELASLALFGLFLPLLAAPALLARRRHARPC